MKRKICVLTGSRAEYGLLHCLLKEILHDGDLDLQIIVTGMHLSDVYGRTVDLIESDGFKIDKKIDILKFPSTDLGISKTIGLGIPLFADALKDLQPDILVLLGDRFEVFAAACAAYVIKIPIAHIHGGESTEGCLDEGFRHSITKLSSLHFPVTELYRNRIIKMGEQPDRVFNFGAPGIDMIREIKLLTKTEIEQHLQVNIKFPTAICTFNPVTLENNASKNQIENLMIALGYFHDLNIIFTLPNADPENEIITRNIFDFCKKNLNRSKSFQSLGSQNYLSLLNIVDLMIGNSSSGIIEAPSFSLPVVNIGDRQKGRVRCENVIDCSGEKDDIIRAIETALKMKKNSIKNLFGEGGSSKKIKETLKNFSLDETVFKKSFYDESR